ncbi:N(4)-(beta-N-acetylglucosaminyl)-L-asparaginase [Telluribacter sp.]|jgi:N4-(beta-N-acetylglucosaminyl)-L-asparaginase|uniref:isoaspartyl peptidase/L-asparaginase family protein n=1 Tax=Telluribacter sp. TaxID=1978767 RepID=UPI002E139F3D|nr:N(4)-(beta-N-acetylglucosaminyl)-L-asparaginase [Telluribacter sp.]
MLNRREFLQAGGAALLSPTLTEALPIAEGGGLPMAICTWDRLKANEAAKAVLEKKGRALDAVEAGVKVQEADPNDTSVGYGGLPDRDGHVTLDACIMDEKGNAGAVTYLEHIMHPISVARLVMEKTPHVMLSGAGALRFALANGFKKTNLLTPQSEKIWKEWLKTAKYKPIVNVERHDTIGMLVLDAQGDMSGACTTSGMAFKLNGRVGDSPIIGAGLYVDNEVGGACATGVGEFVMRTLGSFLLVELMRQGRTPQQACEEAIGRIVKGKTKDDFRDFQVGYLAVNKKGEYGAYSIQQGFNFALYQNGQNRVIESDYWLK